MRWSEHRLVSFDGTPIFYRRLGADGAAKAVVLIVHGMGEHGGRYKAFAEYLAGLGLESVIPDLRGFGLSGGKRACVRRFSDFHGDLAALHAFIARSDKEKPLFLFGHSLGGLVVSSYLAFCGPPQVRGLVLSSPIFGIALPVPLWRRAAAGLCSYVTPDFQQPSHVSHSMLTHDPVLIEEYKNDPLIYHKVSVRLYCELVRMFRRKAAIAGKISIPVLAVQAGQDLVVSKGETLRFYDHLRAEDKEIEIYENFYHEVLNETDRGRVFSRIGLWITGHLNHN